MRPSTIIPLLIWIPAAAALLFIISLGLPRGKSEWYAVGVVLPAVIIQFAVSSRLHRQRCARLLEHLAGLGFEQDVLTGRALHYSDQPGRHAFTLHFAAKAEWRARYMHVAEYSYDTGRGRSRRTHTVTEVAAGIPAGVPSFELHERRNVLARPVRGMFRGSDVRIDDRRFSRRWTVRTSEPDEVLALFTPELIEWLAGAPAREQAWRCDVGWLSCTVRRACYPHDVEPILGRLAAAVSRLPAVSEMEARAHTLRA